MREKVVDVYREMPDVKGKTLSIVLPVPPSINAIYANKRNGGKRLTDVALQYIATSRALINLAIEEQRWDIQGKGVWIYIDMVYYFPDRRIRDSHNCLKLLLDVMQGYVYENDYTVLPRIQSVEYDKENPRVELRVSHQTKNNRDRGIKTTQNVVY